MFVIARRRQSEGLAPCLSFVLLDRRHFVSGGEAREARYNVTVRPPCRLAVLRELRIVRFEWAFIACPSVEREGEREREGVRADVHN